MRRLALIAGAWICITGLFLTGCSVPLLEDKSDLPESHIHVLEWAPGTSPVPAARDAPSLLIAPPRASAGYAGSDMIYIREALELHHFAYHRWVDSPARMLEPLLLSAIESSGRFREVIPAGSQALADLRLDTQILYLRQRFEKDSCHVELAIRSDLIEVATGKAKGGRTFRYSALCDSFTPQGGVSAINRLLGEFLEGLGTALAALLR